MHRQIGQTVPESQDRPAVTGNSFLDSLPDATRIRLGRQLVETSLKRRDILVDSNESAKDVFFPTRSMISTITETLEGLAVEVGLAGHEGLSPISLAFGNAVARNVTVVQIPGSAHTMKAAAFLAELEADAELKQRALRFAEYSFAAGTQFTACNGIHDLQERFARWILMADDRMGTEEFTLTQEYSAQMLGVRRATVTAAAQSLSKEGLIFYRRGVMSVKDRVGLEDVACECYAAVNSDLLRLMGYGARQLRMRT